MHWYFTTAPRRGSSSATRCTSWVSHSAPPSNILRGSPTAIDVDSNMNLKLHHYLPNSPPPPHPAPHLINQLSVFQWKRHSSKLRGLWPLYCILLRQLRRRPKSINIWGWRPQGRGRYDFGGESRTCTSTTPTSSLSCSSCPSPILVRMALEGPSPILVRMALQGSIFSSQLEALLCWQTFFDTTYAMSS